MNLAFSSPHLAPRWTQGSISFPFFAKTPLSLKSATISVVCRRGTPLMVNADIEPPSAQVAELSKTQSITVPTTGFGFSDPRFASAVEGEWFGYECSFSVRDGEARSIPDRYIPDDFREWGVEIKGFESLTSSNLFNDGSSLLMKRTRAMPSVGCEADAVVPEVHEHTFSNIEEKRVSGGFPDGSVICGPAVMTNEHSQRWDVCLTDPTDGVKSRVRLQFSLVNEPFGAVNAMIEHWDAPFCNGEVLPGCGGKNESFADGARMDPVAELVGKWDISSILYTARDGEWEMEELSFEIDRDGATVSAEINVVLPHGITVGIACAEDGTKTVVAGWKTAENIRAVSRQVYASSGVLLCVSRDVESRAC